MYIIVKAIDKNLNDADVVSFVDYYQKYNIDGFVFLTLTHFDLPEVLQNTIFVICDEGISYSACDKFSKIIQNVETDCFLFLNIDEFVDVENLILGMLKVNKYFDIDIYNIWLKEAYLYAPRLYRKKNYYRLDKIYNNELSFLPNMTLRLDGGLDSFNGLKIRSKSIIFIYQSFVMGGIETRTSDEIGIYQQLDYTVYVLVLSGQIDYNSIPKGVMAFCCHKNISEIRDWIFCQGQLRFICDYFDIDIIHSQANNEALLLSAVTASLTNRPLIYTLHGSAPLFETTVHYWQSFVYKYILAKNISHVYAMSPHLAKIAEPYGRVETAENVVDVDRFCHKKREYVDERWLVIGRVDGDKLVGIANFIEYAYKVGIPGVVIIGSNALHSERSLVESTYSSTSLKDYVEFVGHKNSDEIADFISRFAGVAGVGRVVLEGMSCQKPTCVIGINGGVRGLIRQENFHIFAESVFNGSNMPNITVEKFKEQIDNINQDELFALRDLVKTKYSLQVWRSKIQKWEVDHKPFKSVFVESLFSRLCFFSDIIDGSFCHSKLFVKIIEDLIYSPEFYNEKTVNAFLKYKKDFNEKFFYPSAYKLRSDISINIENPVNDGQCIFSVKNVIFSSSSDDIEWRLNPYLLSSGKYEIVIDYLVEATEKNDSDILLSFVFKDLVTGDVGEDISESRITNLSKSSDKRAGYFRYMPIMTRGVLYENNISFEMDSDMELSVLKLVNWRFFKKEKQAINLVSLNITVRHVK